MFGLLNRVLCRWCITATFLAWSTWHRTNSELWILEISSWTSKGCIWCWILPL